MSDVVCEVIAQLPTKYGTFEAHGYVDQRSGEHHVALVKGDIADGEPVLCRVHSECLTRILLDLYAVIVENSEVVQCVRLRKKDEGFLIYASRRTRNWIDQ